MGRNHTPHLFLDLQEPPAQAWSRGLPSGEAACPAQGPSRRASRHQLVDTRPR